MKPKPTPVCNSVQLVNDIRTPVKEPIVNVQVKLRRSVHKTLKRISHAEEVSMQVLIESLITNYLEEKQ